MSDLVIMSSHSKKFSKTLVLRRSQKTVFSDKVNNIVAPNLVI